MWNLNRTMKIKNKCLMKEQIKVSFSLWLVSNSYVTLLCGKMLRLIFYLSVELLFYALVMFTKKELKEEIKNPVFILIMKVCVFLFDILLYSYACISSVTYILCLFCLIVEITPQRKN